MSEVTGSDPPSPAVALTAGGLLRAAREAQGWSIDTVSQQLKLAPRQVHALEDDRHDDLPGRTFVRGFARNYARLVGLDPEAVIAAMPDRGGASAPEGAPLTASSRSIGEMPAPSAPRAGWFGRWAIPVLLVALIAAAAFYEFARPGMWSKGSGVREPAAPITRKAADAPAGTTGVALPNPLTAGEATTASAPPSPPAADAAPAPSAAALTPAAAPGQAPAGGIPGPQAMSGAITTGASGSGSTSMTPASAPSPASATPPGTAGEATLVIAYRQSAWTEVRDAKGQRVLLHTGAPGTRQSVQGTPPLDLTLGNATEVSVTWRGASVDLAPHIAKNNIARVRLQ